MATGEPGNSDRVVLEGEVVDQPVSETKLALRKNVDPYSGLDILTLGSTLAKSGYFADAKTASEAVVKVLYGREIGLGPVASMVGIHIIEGKPSLGAISMATLIRRSGRYEYKVREHTDTACTIEFFDVEVEDGKRSLHLIGPSRYTIEDAKQAGLYERSGPKGGPGNWKKVPKNMLFARAMSNGVKWYCADVFGGPVYDEDEAEEFRAHPHHVPATVVQTEGLTAEAVRDGTVRAQNDAPRPEQDKPQEDKSPQDAKAPTEAPKQTDLLKF